MAKQNFQIGEMIKMVSDDWKDFSGIVSQPITEDSVGHVLLQKDGCILGVKATIKDVVHADSNCEGFAQLAYNLIKLGSHVIEDRLILE
jgi:hypothetical protein